MKAKNLDNIIGKLLDLTKQIYLREPDDGSGLVERFTAGKSSANQFPGSSFGIEWWITPRVFECCEYIADMSISFEPQLEGGDKESFSRIIRETLRKNIVNANIFTFEGIFLRKSNTLFEARAIENPKEFASYLWNEVRENLSDSLVKWLTMYPLRLVKTDSYILGFDGLTLLRANDQQQWEKISERYYNSRYWMPSTGTWVNEVNDHTMKDFLFSPSWLVCETSGTASSTRSISADNMRTFIALLLSCLNEKIPSLLTKSGADAASYSIQFPEDESKAGCGSISAGIGNLFPPLLVDSSLNVSADILSEIQSWYELRSKSSNSIAKRATTAAHFVHYGIISNELERFIHFFIALDALFGERNRVEKNIKEGIGRTFLSQADWENRADKLFELRNELIHGGISSIKMWDALEHYRRCFKSHPMKDIQTAAMTALTGYFSNKIFEHLFGGES